VADGAVIDLPDVGCRYYTYPWTAREVLRMAAAHGTAVWILDRPNPLGGTLVEGNLPSPDVYSAVCASAVPIRHGLTFGELARWNAIKHGLQVELTDLPITGWSREMLWPETGLPWVPPSPAIRSWEAALASPGTCLFEGTNISEGRGTDRPFLTIGAPFVDADALLTDLGRYLLPGVRSPAVRFKPALSKWAGELCTGVALEVTDPRAFRHVLTGLCLLAAVLKYPAFKFIPRKFDALTGGSEMRTALERGDEPIEIARGWSEAASQFLEASRTVLMYGS